MKFAQGQIFCNDSISKISKSNQGPLIYILEFVSVGNTVKAVDAEPGV